METPTLERLKASVKPRVKLDLSKIESRYTLKQEKKKENKDKSNNDPSELSSQAKEYLNYILEDPDIPITTRGDRLGFNSHMTTKAKNELITRGMVKQYEVNLGRANKLLEITDAGYKYLKIKTPMQQGKGSREHKYWQRRILSNRHESGHKAKIEWYLNGKSADVGVVMDGKPMAVEVALTPKNEVRNVKEDLAVGFHSVLVACRNSKVKQEVDKRINENLEEEEKERVATCLLTDFI